MSTDRELLEKAAKAVNGGAWHPLTHDTPDGRPWNPLTDDGDALRLAVQLGLSVQVCYDSVQPLPWLRVTTRCQRWEHAMTDEYAADPYAATRRAIVRAAAAIATKGER
jgi:hypothetical protein